MTSSHGNGAATETSPLLSNPDGLRRVSSRPIEPGAALVPEGADAGGSYDGEDGAENGGDDVEGQAGDGARPKALRDDPNMRKRLPWVLAAVSVGVGQLQLHVRVRIENEC